MNKNYYEVLGTDETTSEEDIKRVDNELITKYDSDTKLTVKDEERFKKFNEVGDNNLRDQNGDKGLVTSGKPFAYAFRNDPRDTFAESFRTDDIFEVFVNLSIGEQEIELSDKYKDVVLVLGNTGAGKSTFTQWMAGDNDKLISKEVSKGTGEFIIEDNDKIGNSTIDSKTVFPELVVDNKTNTAYYDCPGFSDTRGTSSDIATTYYIKKVVDHAKSVKMVFVTSHHSVRKGVEREDFMKLLRHATDFVRNISKFQNSIAIVVTKVDNQYVKEGKSFVLVADDKVITAIAEFLQEVKDDLRKKLTLPETSAKEKKFYGSAIKFIDVVLEKDDKHDTNIGIFRRPDEAGPLSNITLLQKGKENIDKIIYEKLNFTIKDDADFGYTISDKSKKDINNLVDEINKNIWSSLSEIAEKVQTYYHDLIEQVRNKISSFVDSTTFVGADPSEAHTFSSKLRNGYNITLNLVEELRNVKYPQEIAEAVNNSMNSLDIDMHDYMLNITNQGKFLNFLQIVSDKKLNTRPWDEIFKGILPYFSESRRSLQDNVVNAAEKVNNQIQSNLNHTAKAIQEQYSAKMAFLEIQKLLDPLKKGYDGMSNMAEEIRNLTTTKELLQTIEDSTSILDISTPNDNMQNIANQGAYFDYLEILSDEKLPITFTAWVEPFEDLVKYLYESEKWYNFLDGLYTRFSEYDIQKTRDKYNVANIEDWGQSGKAQGIAIMKSNFERFLNKTAEYNITDYDNIKNIGVTDLQLEELNHVLSLTLKHKMDIQCTEPYIQIKGTYVSIDDAMSNSCVSTALTSGKYKFLKIFATSTIFIDKDLLLSSLEMPVTMIAPKWEVIGNRRIELNGAKGDKGVTKPKAKNGVHPGSKGEDGKPGEPGKPGENFFGVGDSFENGTNLTIMADGGTGGSGQEGGDGFQGVNGRSPNVPKEKNTPCKDGCSQIDGFKCEKKSYSYLRGGCGGFGVQTECWPPTVSCTYKIFGEPGKKGGDGGDGGRGGKGGKHGYIELFELNTDSGILKNINNGTDGDSGKGGNGGTIGNNGDDIIVSYFSYRTSTDWTLQQRISNKGGSASGKNGTDGANIHGMQDPDEAAVIDDQKSIIINEYKSYLRETLSDRFVRYPLINFLDKLDSDNKVKGVYNTLGLINELQGLEDQFHGLSKGINFVPFYQSLLKRISEYAQCPKASESTTQHKKVLNYLYTAILGKIYYVKDNSEPLLIVDINGYLDLVIKDIEKLKDMQKEKNKADIINKFKDDYKSNIDKKIAEARTFIEKQISPEIDNINTQVDGEIDSLINETIDLEKKAEEEKEELIKKKEKLENTLQLRGLFSFFKIAGQVISFLGPVGAAVGSVVGATSSITESLVLDEKTDQQRRFQLPPSVISNIQALGEEIKSARNKKITSLNKLLEQIIEEANKHSENLNDTSKKVAAMKKRLNKITSTKFDFKEVKALENELKQELKRKEGELKTKNIDTDKKAADALAVVEKLKQIAQLAEVGFDIYTKYKNDKAKLDALTDAIQQAENKFQQLKRYEEKIYNSIVPMLQNMADNLQDVADKLDAKSQVALDITKWRVQGTLRDMKLQMRQMTQGFQVTDNLARCIEKLEEAMTTLINVYDRIHSYQEQQNLANYIADISSTIASGINITDSKLIKAVNHLETSIRSNLVLKQYKTVIEAFKQFVFPFAHLYLEKLTPPSHLELENNIENLVYNSVTEIESIKSEVDVYKTSVRGYDKYIHIGEFSSNYVSTKPFFVWKNEHYNDAISKLLSGQEIIVKSDIKDSPSDRDALKFSVINLNFKVRNETTQSTINNTLKAFRVSATHLGNSYYRYDDKLYVIESGSQSIQYSFEKNPSGEPIDKNVVYDKIKGGDLMLSPYAMWKIRLFNYTQRISFHDLETYKNEIDLELVGLGSYVYRDTIDLDLKVDEYYKTIDPYNRTNLNAELKAIYASNSPSSNFCNSTLTAQFEEMVRYPVSNTATGFSSPINYISNLLKECTMVAVSNIMASFNHIFSDKDEIVKMEVGNGIPDDTVVTSSIDEVAMEAENQEAMLEMGTEDEIVTSEVVDVPILIVEKEFLISNNGVIQPSYDSLSISNFNDFNDNSKPHLSNKQQGNYNIKSVPQMAELNSSLLLADLLNRYVTGRKYKHVVDESLLSPKDWIARRINDGAAQSEDDINQNFQRLLPELDGSISWFTKVKSSVKSTFQFFGFFKEEVDEDYIQDIRGLFSFDCFDYNLKGPNF